MFTHSELTRLAKIAEPFTTVPPKHISKIFNEGFKAQLRTLHYVFEV